MQSKILTTENYLKIFNFQERDTCCGVEQDRASGENYLYAQVFLPKIFFNLNAFLLRSKGYSPSQVANMFQIPDKILVKFELFGIGAIGENEAYIFKPWIVGIDDPAIYTYLENFHLFIPSTLFYHLIEQLIFNEQLNQDLFKNIRVLQDIPLNTFQRFGLNRENVPRSFESSNLKISRIDNPDKKEISEFYRQHWTAITDTIEHKYFRPHLNTWFKVALKSHTETIGFIRLYNSNSTFTGGTSLEYVIDQSYRNKRYATEASLSVIDNLKKYSYAISVDAEVDEKNEYSIKVLNKLGFLERKSSNPLHKANFHLPLFDTLNNIESGFENNSLKLSIQSKYSIKYRNYF